MQKIVKVYSPQNFSDILFRRRFIRLQSCKKSLFFSNCHFFSHFYNYVLNMDLTIVSNFTANTVPADFFMGRFQLWRDSVRRMSGVSPAEEARRYLASDGSLCEPTVEFFSNGQTSGDRKIAVLCLEGALLLEGERAIKTKMVVELCEKEFIGQFYMTFVGFPTEAPIERRYFTLWNILQGNIIKTATPFQWLPGTAPKILAKNSPLVKILEQVNNSCRKDFVNIPSENTPAENAPKNNEDMGPGDAPQEELPAVTAPKILDLDENDVSRKPPKSDDKKSPALEGLSPNQQLQEIEMLRSRLEKAESENESLFEKNEELTCSIRNFKKEKKALQINIQEQKDRIKKLRKRAENAEQRAKEAASGDTKTFCEYFENEMAQKDLEIQKKDAEIEKLVGQISELTGKNNTLKGRLGKQGGSFTEGLLRAPEDESEKYTDEFGIALFSALHIALENTPTKCNSPRTRSIDVWQAIIDANPDIKAAYKKFCENKDALKIAVAAGELDKKTHLLKPFNMTLGRHTNAHGKITFGADDRYTACTASTASETASGFSNSAKDIRNAFLYPT